MDVAFVVLGLAGLLLGGEMLVRGAVAQAVRWRISPMVVGLTLVGFGTSVPELLTSVQAALAGAPDIALGNVIGSNIANILLICGLGAALAPIIVPRVDRGRDVFWLALATLGAAIAVMQTEIGAVAGAALMAALAVFMLHTLSGRSSDDLPLDAAKGRLPPLLVFALGLGATLLGARALVTGAIGLAEALGVSQAIIGLTIVAVGTSLPELVTTLIAARRGASDVALGNIIGSNIFNIFGILGATALIAPLPVSRSLAQIDAPAMLAATAVLIALMLRGRISRRAGLSLVVAYVAYLALRTTL